MRGFIVAVLVTIAPGTARAAVEPVRVADVEPALANARRLVTALEFDDAIVALGALRARPDVIGETRIEVLFLLGYALAVARDPIDAEDPFGELCRLAPQWEPPPDTQPKIMAVFRKAQVDAQRLRDEREAKTRARMLARLDPKLDVRSTVNAGNAVTVTVSTRDGARDIDRVRVDYRVAGEADFYAFPLRRHPDGAWRGEIPATFTAEHSGAVIELYATLKTSDGTVLVELGDADKPHTVVVDGSDWVVGAGVGGTRLEGEELAFPGLAALGGGVAGALASSVVFFGYLAIANALNAGGPVLGLVLVALVFALPPVGTYLAVLPWLPWHASLIPATATLLGEFGLLAGFLLINRNSNDYDVDFAGYVLCGTSLALPVVTASTVAWLIPPE